MAQQVTTGIVLSDTFATARQLTRYYLSKLKGFDPHLRFEVEDKRLNSTYWMVAHLIWAEDFLLLRSLGHKGLDISWLEEFKVGSDADKVQLDIPFKELLDIQKECHLITLDHLRNMTEEEFQEENSLGIRFGEETKKRYIAMHGIRHEATHTGQLSIITKLAGGNAI